jgi:glucose/arabinose dehydrogenase
MRARHATDIRIWRTAIRLLAIVSLLAGGTVALAQSDSPLLLGDDPRIESGAFRVTVFAEDLDFPMGMARLPDDSLLVGISRPIGGGYFRSTGELRRFVDSDRDGVADDEGQVVASDLPGTIVAVGQARALVFVTSAAAGEESISVLRAGESWAEPLTTIEKIDFNFNQEFLHQTYGLAVRPHGDDPGQVELFFNVGASGNDTSGKIVTLTGLVSATLNDAAIYRVIVDDTGPKLTVSPPELIATGLRNAAAFGFAPESGDLIITDNGIDTPADPIVALSADEINRIPADQIGGAPEHFGFPDSYIAYATGETIGDWELPPLIAFRPIDGSENEGAASLAFAPAHFPARLNTGVFVGFHGQYDDSGITNEENPLVYADLETGETFDFISNNDEDVGHLDSLLATDDTLYAADLCGSDGFLSNPTRCGVIYAIQAVDPLAT